MGGLICFLLSFFLDSASHPYQTKGARESYGAKEVKDGFYVWVDMPGVTKDKVSVGVENGWVLFSGEAGKESIHEESGRTYQGSFGPFDVNKIGKIKTEVKNGVLRMMIPEIGPEWSILRGSYFHLGLMFMIFFLSVFFLFRPFGIC